MRGVVLPVLLLRPGLPSVAPPLGLLGELRPVPLGVDEDLDWGISAFAVGQAF